MKKILCFAVVLTFVASSAFAATLDSVLTSTKLSNQVSGTYWANGTGADDATSYVLSTGHAQGNKVFASGSFVSEIFQNDIAGDAFASGTDLLHADPTWASGIDESYFTDLSFEAL